MEFLEATKNQANSFLSADLREIAINIYQELLNHCKWDVISDGIKQMETLNQMKLSLHLNMALYYLREKRPHECIDSLQEGLKLDTSNEKCLYRMGQAKLLLGDHDEALVYFSRVLKAHPENTEAAAKVKFCEGTLSEAVKQEKRMFKAAFKRLGDVCQQTFYQKPINLGF